MSDCDAESMDAAFGSGDESGGGVTLDCVFGLAGTRFEICVSRDASVGQLVNHIKNAVKELPLNSQIVIVWDGVNYDDPYTKIMLTGSMQKAIKGDSRIVINAVLRHEIQSEEAGGAH